MPKNKLPYEVDRSIRIKQLLEDNEKEDRLIKKLEKKLGLSKRKNKNNPPWMAESNFDDLLNFMSEEEESEEDKEPKIIGELPAKKKKKKNIYADEASEETTLFNEPATEANLDPSDSEITKALRRNFNMISESQMTRVCDELSSVFISHPKAQVRRVLLCEVLNLLKFTPFSFRDQNLGWFHQDLAVCIACIALTLYKIQQDVQFRFYLVENLILELLEKESDASQQEYFISLNVFLVYLYRFGIVSHPLILDLALEYAQKMVETRSNIVRVICQIVGVFLRKDDLEKSTKLMHFMKEKLKNDPNLNKNIKFDFEAAIKYLEHKKVKEVWITRAENLKKMIKTWTRGYSLTPELAMSVSLDDIRDMETKGRFWLVGSSYAPGKLDLNEDQNKKDLNDNISPEILEVAKSLGFNTPFRQELFNILAVNDKGPDGAANGLLRACGTKNETRERDMVTVVLHCLLSEQPYNPFYAQVIGSLLGNHRRFLIMVKCSIWDVIQKGELSTEAKVNCSKLCATLFLHYDFPLAMIKKFNFADLSEGNIEFLLSFLNSTIKDGFSPLLLSVRRMCEELPRFTKNLRIFIKKHCKSEDELIRHRFQELTDLIQTLLIDQ